MLNLGKAARAGEPRSSCVPLLSELCGKWILPVYEKNVIMNIGRFDLIIIDIFKSLTVWSMT